MEIPNLNKLRIVRYPDPILKRVCKPVESFGSQLNDLVDAMLVLMHAAQGVGLAAPQVGVAIRLFVCNRTGEPEDDVIFVNPKLSDLEGVSEEPEGCLSIPEVDVTMRRATGVTIEATDAAGNPIRREGKDIEARVWQHEMDHLDGRLITDTMSATDEIANRRALKQLEADFSASTRRKSPS